jgi:hypothetical protein
MEQKRAKVEEMRKMGMKVKKAGSDIPFGVRAIQGGVEVDGIWIARKTERAIGQTAEKGPESSVTTNAVESELSNSGKKVKERPQDHRISDATSQLGQFPSASASDMGPTSGRNSRMESLGSSPPLTPGQAQYMKGKGLHSQRLGVNEAALRKLDGRSPAATQTTFDQYQPVMGPTSAPHAPARRSTPIEPTRARPGLHDSSGDSVSSSVPDHRASAPLSAGHDVRASYVPQSQSTQDRRTDRRVRALSTDNEIMETSTSSVHQSIGQSTAYSSFGSASPNRSPQLSPSGSVIMPSPVFKPKQVNELRSSLRANQYASHQSGSGDVDIERGVMDDEGQVIDTSRFTRQTRRSQKPVNRPGEAGRQRTVGPENMTDVA